MAILILPDELAHYDLVRGQLPSPQKIAAALYVVWLAWKIAHSSAPRPGEAQARPFGFIYPLKAAFAGGLKFFGRGYGHFCRYGLPQACAGAAYVLHRKAFRYSCLSACRRYRYG
ncbi:MAG: hypothetical protein U5N55_07365 [Cypionkella sp.]|nr:hypothetical protein [Cypionkella sp.]